MRTGCRSRPRRRRRPSRELRVEIPEIGPGIELRAGDAPQQIAGRVLAAVAVDVLPQPFAQRRELATRKMALEVAELGDRTLPDLHGDDVAELVGREVAEEPDRPVHVLEDPACVVRHLDTEVGLHARVPDLRQLAAPDRAGQRRWLGLEREGGMEAERALSGVTRVKT